MRAHWFQHVPFEGLGIIESWLDNAGCEKTSTTFFEAGHLPDLDAIDFLIIMGGPMSVNDNELSSSKFVMDATSILASTDKNCTTANQLMGDVLAYLTRIPL